MPKQSADIFADLLKSLDLAVDGFLESIPNIQREVFSELIDLVKDLDISNGRLKNSVANLKKIGQIKTQLERIVLGGGYQDETEKFLKQFDKITTTMNEYFTLMSGKFKMTSILKEIKAQAISSTINSLTEAGVSYHVIEPIQDILRQNITGGGTVKSFVTVIQEFVIGSDQHLGGLAKYAKQIATDALHQYAAQYMKQVSDDLGMNWYMYVGNNKDTTRQFCEDMTKKRYIHRSEFAAITKKDWAGKIDGTDQFNFPINRGGWNCRHQLRPVSDELVPPAIRAKFA